MNTDVAYEAEHLPSSVSLPSSIFVHLWLGILKILRQDVIRALAPTLVHFGCRRVDPLAVEVEGLQQSRLVEGHVGLDLLQGAFADEKWRFQGTVVPRKSDGMNGVIVEAAFVGKA